MFTFVRIRLTLSFGKRSFPPFHFFSLASRFEDACQGSSVFDELYGRRIPDDPVAVRRFQKPSSSLILTPPVLPPEIPSATLLTLDVVLVGSSSVCAGPVIARLIPLLETGYAVHVEGVSLAGVYHQQEVPLDGLSAVAEFPLAIATLDDLTRQLEVSGAGQGVRLRFLTPLKLVRHGRALQQVGGADLLRALLRRTSSLAYHYCRYEFPVDYSYLSALADSVGCDVSGLRHHDGAGRGGGGLAGEMVLGGSLEPFLPFLAAGSVIHLGKGAAQGYGCYQLLPGAG